MRVCLRILLTQKIIVWVGVFVFIGFIVVPAVASDRFVDHGDGTVTDTKTGLMWAAKDNGSHINWPNSLSHCQNFGGGGHTDWRMPTLWPRGSPLQFHVRPSVLAPPVLLWLYPGLASAEWQLTTPVFCFESLYRDCSKDPNRITLYVAVLGLSLFKLS